MLRVSGELVAAGKLAERKASHSEATERLERLQELAGKFRRTQRMIEDKLDDPEAASVEQQSKEFDSAYQAAKELLEKHISSTKPVRAVRREVISESLLNEILRFRDEVREWQAANDRQLYDASERNSR